jgi:hypothetical protein
MGYAVTEANMKTVKQIVHDARVRARTILVERWSKVRALAHTSEDDKMLNGVADAFQLLIEADAVEDLQDEPGVGLSSLTPGAGSSPLPAPGGEGDD